MAKGTHERMPPCYPQDQKNMNIRGKDEVMIKCVEKKYK